MREYFAASRKDVGNWGNSRWYDEYTASLSLGTLTDEEVTRLREAVEGREPNEHREIYIVSDDCIRARILSATFFEKVYRHIEENTPGDRPVKPSDFPPYFHPIKEAYLAACAIQTPQRLPNFDSLFSFENGPVSVIHVNQEPSTDAIYIVDGIGHHLERFFPPSDNETDETNKEWVRVDEAAKRLSVEKETLERYRNAGPTKPDENRPGIDSQGNIWKYIHEGKKSVTFYLLPIASPDK